MTRSMLWSYRCHTCGEVFAAWETAQRHADSHGGARLDLVLPDPPAAAVEDVPTGGVL